MSAARAPRPDDVLIEAVRLGAYVKVTAVHAGTGLEAVASGPAREPRAVEAIAVAKLRRKLDAL